MTNDQMAAAAAELSKRNYRTLCEAEIIDVLKKHSGRQGVEAANLAHGWHFIVNGKVEYGPISPTAIDAFLNGLPELD